MTEILITESVPFTEPMRQIRELFGTADPHMKVIASLLEKTFDEPIRVWNEATGNPTLTLRHNEEHADAYLALLAKEGWDEFDAMIGLRSYHKGRNLPLIIIDDWDELVELYSAFPEGHGKRKFIARFQRGHVVGTGWPP